LQAASRESLARYSEQKSWGCGATKVAFTSSRRFDRLPAKEHHRMKLKTIALFSLALNVALAGWLALRPSRPPIVREYAAPPAAPVVTPAPPVARTTFHWRQVESADYRTYIANLRAIGCPEETIRDIIVEDVNKLYAPRYAALAGSAPELTWWGRFEKRNPVRVELAAQLRALNDEKKSLLHRLLGASAPADVTFLELDAAAVREQTAFAFLPEARQAAVRDLVSRYRALHEWSETQWNGLPGDEREARERELRESRRRELASLLTPEEMREFELRDSVTANVLRQQYGGGDLTEAEFRKLYDLRRDFEEQHPDARPEDWKQLDAQIANALGPERFTDIQRQNDSMWRAMQTMAGERGLTPDSMQSAHAIQRDYMEKMAQAVGQMFADPQQDPQPLRNIAAQMDAQLAEIVGGETVKQLDRLGVLPRLIIQDDGKHKSYSFSRRAFGE
jgi:hypothetical protein